MLRFISRVAFICNCFFLIALAMQMMKHPPEGEVVATTIIIGYVFAGAVNLMANVLVAAAFISKKLSGYSVPRWLIMLNFLFLIPELIIFLR